MVPKISFLILLVFLIQAKQLSPLRYVQDIDDNDISLTYTGERFLISVKSAMTVSQLILCFRLRPVTVNPTEKTCFLNNQKDTYDCLTIDLITHVGIHWQADYQLNIISGQTPFTFNYFVNSSTLIYSLDGKFNGNTTFEYLSSGSQIYQVVSISYEPYQVKRVYTHTFSVIDQVRSNNLLLQRQVQCFTEGINIYLLFLGGVIRDESNYYMVAFLTYSILGNLFTFWGGLSFSQDKAGRDMLGVYPFKDTYADLYSLYAAPPFKDISINVNGTQDWTKISSSFAATQGQLSSYYFISLYRNYQSTNTNGDEEIILKMNNKYCFVCSTNPSFYLLDVQQPYAQNYMHTLLKCFNPNIELYSKLLAFSLIFMIFILLL